MILHTACLLAERRGIEIVAPERPNKLMDAADSAIGPREHKPRKRGPSPASTLISQCLAATRGR